MSPLPRANQSSLNLKTPAADQLGERNGALSAVQSDATQCRGLPPASVAIRCHCREVCSACRKYNISHLQAGPSVSNRVSGYQGITTTAGIRLPSPERDCASLRILPAEAKRDGVSQKRFPPPPPSLSSHSPFIAPLKTPSLLLIILHPPHSTTFFLLWPDHDDARYHPSPPGLRIPEARTVQRYLLESLRRNTAIRPASQPPRL